MPPSLLSPTPYAVLAAMLLLLLALQGATAAAAARTHGSQRHHQCKPSLPLYGGGGGDDGGGDDDGGGRCSAWLLPPYVVCFLDCGGGSDGGGPQQLRLLQPARASAILTPQLGTPRNICNGHGSLGPPTLTQSLRPIARKSANPAHTAQALNSRERSRSLTTQSGSHGISHRARVSCGPLPWPSQATV